MIKLDGNRGQNADSGYSALAPFLNSLALRILSGKRWGSVPRWVGMPHVGIVARAGLSRRDTTDIVSQQKMTRQFLYRHSRTEAAVFSGLSMLFCLLMFPLTQAVAEEDASWSMFLAHPAHSQQPISNLVPPLVPIWRFDAGDLIFASPTVSAGKVFIGSLSGVFYALDTVAGELVWAYETGAEITSSAAISGGRVFFGGKDGTLYCLDERSGKLLWSYKTQGKIVNSPVVVGGVVYFGSNDMNFYALQADDGGLIWATPLAEKATSSRGIYSSAAVVDGIVYVTRKAFKLFALDAKTGHVLWDFQTHSALYSSPVVVGDTLYIGGYDRRLYALDARQGGLKWQAEVDDWIYASPVEYQGKVYVASKDGMLTAFHAVDGERLWSQNLNGPISATPVVTASGIGVVGNEWGELVVFDAQSGKLTWKDTLRDDGFHSSPAVVGDRLYIATINGYVMAWGARQ